MGAQFRYASDRRDTFAFRITSCSALAVPTWLSRPSIRSYILTDYRRRPWDTRRLSNADVQAGETLARYRDFSFVAYVAIGVISLKLPERFRDIQAVGGDHGASQSLRLFYWENVETTDYERRARPREVSVSRGNLQSTFLDSRQEARATFRPFLRPPRLSLSPQQPVFTRR